jgi:hypothetical protein
MTASPAPIFVPPQRPTEPLEAWGEAHRKRHLRTALGCLGCATPVLLVFGLVVAGAILAPDAERASAADEAYLFDVEYLAAWLEQPPDPAFAQTFREAHSPESYTLTYHYADEDSGLYLSNRVSRWPSAVEASRRHMETFRDEAASLRASGLRLEERGELFQWGDLCIAGMIFYGDTPVGNVFFAQKGRVSFMVMLQGGYFDEPDDVAELLEPYVAALDPLVR